MKIKNFKNQVKVEKIETPEVCDKVVKPYDGDVVNKSFFRRPFPIRIAITFTILVLVAVFAIVFIPDKTTQLISVKNSNVNYVKNEEQLKELINYQKNDPFSLSDLLIVPGAMAKFDAVAEDASADRVFEYSSVPKNGGEVTEKEVSSTNNQINGVDEADIVKCDGDKIYRLTYVNGKICVIINEINNGEISEDKVLELGIPSSTGSFREMYVNDKYIITLGLYYEDNNIYYTGSRGYWYTHNFVIAKIFDKNTFELVKEYKSLAESIDASRLVEGDIDCLYFVYNQRIREEDNKISMPDYLIDGEKEVIEIKDIAYFGNIVNKAYTYIVSIKLDDELTVNKQVQLGASYWTDVYCTKNSIYLIALIGAYATRNLLINKDVDEYYTSTSVIKYEIDNGSIKPVSGLYTRGSAQNQFYVDEYNGYLRLALSEVNHNKVEVYKLELNEENKYEYKLVGAITEGLGEHNEKIKSVRFNGNECLIVTAKNTDPLYKIDLSNPEKPVILGKFKEDGYNSYLQYLTGELEGLAIGLGYNTKDVSDYYLIKTGTKIGLYDVTGDAPVQIDEINYSITAVDACENHKALFIYKGYIGFYVNDTYKLYEVANTEEGYKLNEVLSYAAKKLLGKEEYDWDYCADGRMYYVDGYFYLANIAEGYLYDNMIVSFDSEFNKIK